MLLLLRWLWDRRQGSRGTVGSPVGGRVTPRVPDAEDRALCLKMIPRDCMDFCHSLLMLGTGCVCEGVHGHLQPPRCLYLPCSGFSPFPPHRGLISFPGKIFASCAGEIQWLLAASIMQTGMSWHTGLSIRKTDVSAATEVCKELPQAWRGRSRRGEWCDQRCLSSLSSHLGSDLGLQILPCDIVTRLGSDPKRREIKA